MDYAFERISSEHDLFGFTCGVDDLDNWLAKEALPAQTGGLSVTHVSVDPDDEYRSVLGYFTLCPTTVHEAGGGSRDDGYPGYLLCKLARHLDLKGTNHGDLLLSEAIARTVEAADAAGGRFLVVDPMVTGDPAKDQKLRAFYRDANFKDIDGTDRMSIQIQTLRSAFRSA
ncbi:hypothetical protein [Nocardia abscessus]|uniref:hypothetical protein n=1 Tax=Nocardia abscessus TaxID=120957 RepID=UPI002454487F|nr:hypothetical protein [Nocardia abscessus]